MGPDGGLRTGVTSKRLKEIDRQTEGPLFHKFGSLGVLTLRLVWVHTSFGDEEKESRTTKAGVDPFLSSGYPLPERIPPFRPPVPGGRGRGCKRGYRPRISEETVGRPLAPRSVPKTRRWVGSYLVSLSLVTLCSINPGDPQFVLPPIFCVSSVLCIRKTSESGTDSRDRPRLCTQRVSYVLFILSLKKKKKIETWSYLRFPVFEYSFLTN